MTICWTACSLFGWAVCKRNPVYLNSEKARAQAGCGDLPEELKNYVRWHEAIRMWRFWHLSAMLFLGSFATLYVANVYKIATDGILPDHTLTIAASIGSIGNGVSRLGWATLQDRFGFKNIYAVICAI